MHSFSVMVGNGEIEKWKNKFRFHLALDFPCLSVITTFTDTLLVDVGHSHVCFQLVERFRSSWLQPLKETIESKILDCYSRTKCNSPNKLPGK